MDQNQQNQSQAADAYQQINNPPTLGQQSCPQCGYCPSCGRQNYYPNWQWQRPYMQWTSQTYQ